MNDDILLSDREREVWERYQSSDVTQEEVEEELAEEWDVAPDTVGTYLDRCYAKRKRARATIEWMDDPS